MTPPLAELAPRIDVLLADEKTLETTLEKMKSDNENKDVSPYSPRARRNAEAMARISRFLVDIREQIEATRNPVDKHHVSPEPSNLVIDDTNLETYTEFLPVVKPQTQAHAEVFHEQFPKTAKLMRRNEDHSPLTWRDEANCLTVDPEIFFPVKGGSTVDAKKICDSCEVKVECLGYALQNNERFGVWGGLSDEERRKMRRR